MLALIAKHSSLFLLSGAILGFSFPSMSSALLPALPYILFMLMLFTLIGIDQKALVASLAKPDAWRYALVHAALTTLIVSGIAISLDASPPLLIALVAVCATGSLFATPAIVRSVGFNPLAAMAFTIASTLMMPIVLFVNLTLFSDDSFSLDMKEYVVRLLIFIFGPMLLSYLIRKHAPQEKLSRVHGKIAQFTIVLVFSFPFGLSGQYRWLWEEDRSFALITMAIAFMICVSFFLIGLLVFWRKGKEAAFVAAITSGNRNVLLTYSVAGVFLGPLYLPLIGALQLPTYIQPFVVKFFVNRSRNTIKQPVA
ncbi:hypothetical protein LRP49_00795 [Enterovibrio sp. ZSDZ35]|uniref:Bile acid:Na+ symporter, BASS family n=1 Tax=Enterovibrio qingdaonensis TaxID=2899818 RepID=A0ABT5QFT9_9GAMM|nr:hypothetical protein [Enterovibrio sp. ZSDZ35]MDD1779719.1 hypothetical protein [Enterovibrio sp. ZSDZ35]